MVTKKKAVIEKPKEPLVIVTDKEITYRFNWIMVRRKINAFTQIFRLKKKVKPSIKNREPIPEEIKSKKLRKPRVKKEVKEV